MWSQRCRMLNTRIKHRRVAQRGEYREVGLLVLWQEEGFGKMKVYLGKAVYLQLLSRLEK